MRQHSTERRPVSLTRSCGTSSATCAQLTGLPLGPSSPSCCLIQIATSNLLYLAINIKAVSPLFLKAFSKVYISCGVTKRYVRNRISDSYSFPHYWKKKISTTGVTSYLKMYTPSVMLGSAVLADLRKLIIMAQILVSSVKPHL